MNSSRIIDIQLLRNHFSSARMRPYEAGCSSIEDIGLLYEDNILHGLRFMLVMHFLEIALRNDMYAAMRALLGLHWFQKEDALLESRTNQFARAQTNLRRQGKPPTHDNFIAELPLGFWVGLLAKKYEYRHQYWRRCLHACFPLRPPGTERGQLHDKLNSLRRFRNKVAHHERIIHHDPKSITESAMEVLGWISPQLREWARQLLDKMP